MNRRLLMGGGEWELDYSLILNLPDSALHPATRIALYDKQTSSNTILLVKSTEYTNTLYPYWRYEPIGIEVIPVNVLEELLENNIYLAEPTGPIICALGNINTSGVIEIGATMTLPRPGMENSADLADKYMYQGSIGCSLLTGDDDFTNYRGISTGSSLVNAIHCPPTDYAMFYPNINEHVQSNLSPDRTWGKTSASFGIPSPYEFVSDGWQMNLDFFAPTIGNSDSIMTNPGALLNTSTPYGGELMHTFPSLVKSTAYSAVQSFSTKGTTAGQWYIPSLCEMFLCSNFFIEHEAALFKAKLYGNVIGDTFMETNYLTVSCIPPSTMRDQWYTSASAYFCFDFGYGQPAKPTGIGINNVNPYVGHVRPFTQLSKYIYV